MNQWEPEFCTSCHDPHMALLLLYAQGSATSALPNFCLWLSHSAVPDLLVFRVRHGVSKVQVFCGNSLKTSLAWSTCVWVEPPAPVGRRRSARVTLPAPAAGGFTSGRVSLMTESQGKCKSVHWLLSAHISLASYT